MKPFPLLVATALAVAMVLTPALAFASGSITFASPASGAHYTGTQSYSITGTISPAPGVVDNVFLTVKNPSGVTVDAASTPATPSSGAFSYSTATGGSSNWVSGTYTISATDSYGAAGTTTFTYTAKGTTAVSGITFQAQGSSLVTAGETAYVTALVVLSGTPVSGANFTGSWFWAPGSTSATALGSATAGPAGTYQWTWPITATSHAGLYSVYLSLTLNGSRTWVQTGFTVTTLTSSNTGNLQQDLKGNFTALSNSLGSLNTAVGGLTSAISNLQSTANSINGAVGGLSTSLANIQTTLGNVNTAVQNLSGLSDQLSSTSSGISSTQTYVLVVAVLAAITLVLELAILVRKLS